MGDIHGGDHLDFRGSVISGPFVAKVGERAENEPRGYVYAVAPEPERLPEARPERFILVTVKLPKNPAHNPRAKIKGECPVNGAGTFCTDVTGEHHTFLVFRQTAEEAQREWESKGFHVTRAEEAGAPPQAPT